MCNCGNSGKQLDVMDLATIFFGYIGCLNLMENRQQSAQNDVNAANDKQAKQILSEIGKRLDAQDAMLKKIMEVITNEKPA